MKTRVGFLIVFFMLIFSQAHFSVMSLLARAAEANRLVLIQDKLDGHNSDFCVIRHNYCQCVLLIYENACQSQIKFTVSSSDLLS